jgi:AraC-like DNA-binding protein
MVTIYPPGTAREYLSVPADGTMSCVHFHLGTGKEAERLPLATDFGRDAKDFDRRLLQTVGVYSHSPAHAVALLWELLWELHARTVPLRVEARSRRVVAGVQEEIERHLHEPLTVAYLAKKAGLSSAHLRRLFHREVGVSAKRYIQDRRLARAHHLLMQSDRPIKAVAAEVGIPDLQHFNKVIRKAFGRPPRAVQNIG